MSAPDRRGRLTAFLVAMAVLIAIPVAVMATDVFNDVPASNVHHDNITWLKDTGVTEGCNPPDNDEYCPSENVTRAQMATFMRRLADNQVVDADTVDGKDADDLSVQGWAMVNSDSVTLATPGDVDTAVASCPEGTNVLGGGWTQTDGSFQINYLRNRPNDAGTAWEVMAENAGPNNNRVFSAWAICAQVNP